MDNIFENKLSSTSAFEMKPTIVFLCFVSAVSAQPPMNCMPPPTKKPSQCCESLDKLVKEQMFDSCRMKCMIDFCCAGDCMAQALGFMKDGKFDKDTSTKTVNSVFAGDRDWLSVATKAVNDCFSISGSLKTPPGPTCSSPQNGIIAFCIAKNLFTNCPKPVLNDAECDKTRTFMKCVGM